jgi:nucleoside-diphosphate-sugar epimerase
MDIEQLKNIGAIKELEEEGVRYFIDLTDKETDTNIALYITKYNYINFPIETLLVNSLGTYNLLELARKFNSKFLYTSSSEVYGDPSISPQKESYFGNVNPNGVRSVYDEGKRFGEAITFGYVRKHDLDARIIRIFNTYGPGMLVEDGRVVSNFINQAIGNKSVTIYGKGTQTRSLCYVDDMVSGIKLAMFAPNTKGEVINLGNPDERTIIDIAKKLEGCVRHISVHAAGVVISPGVLTDFTPVQMDPKGGKQITQYEMHAVETAGVLKMDFLGIRNLAIFIII